MRHDDPLQKEFFEALKRLLLLLFASSDNILPQELLQMLGNHGLLFKDSGVKLKNTQERLRP